VLRFYNAAPRADITNQRPLTADSRTHKARAVSVTYCPLTNDQRSAAFNAISSGRSCPALSAELAPVELCQREEPPPTRDMISSDLRAFLTGRRVTLIRPCASAIARSSLVAVVKFIWEGVELTKKRIRKSLHPPREHQRTVPPKCKRGDHNQW